MTTGSVARNDVFTTSLPAGSVLTVSAGASSSGSVTRLSDAPGGEPQGITPLPASSSLTFGPFGAAARFVVSAAGGAISWSIAGASFQTSADVAQAVVAVSSQVPFAKALATAADGTFTAAIPVGTFTAAPVAHCVVAAAGARAHAVTLTTITATSIVGFVRRSRTLPASIALVSDLVSFDPWEDPGVVSVHVVAVPATP